MARRFKGVLFDTIGTTVVEQRPDIIRNCFAEAFVSEGFAVTSAEISSIRGQDKLGGIRQLITQRGGDERVAISVLNRFKENFRSQLRDFREVDELDSVLSQLRNDGARLGVGTGLPGDLFKLLYDHLRWERFRFDFIGISDEIGFSRPHPAMIDLMRQRFGIGKEEFLKVGDTVADIREGKNAGVRTAVIMSGTQSSTLIKNEQPDFICETLSQVVALL